MRCRRLRHNSRSRPFPFLLSLLFSVGLTAAQEPPPPEHTLRVEVGLVNLEAAVTDGAGRFVRGLRRENFRVLEDGVPQSVVHFAPTEAPVRVAMLVEASPAVYLLQREHVATAIHLLRSLRAEDEVALLTYARELREEIPFTRDKAHIEGRLAGLGRYGLGMAELRLLDAVGAALNWLGAEPRRTALVIIGTGIDSGSQTRWEELRRRVEQSQVAIFTLAAGQLLRAEPKDSKKDASRVDTIFEEADARLRALAESTAGQAYFPESAKELARLYREMGERLRHLYSLGYYPANARRDAGFRQITVELVDAQGAPLPYRVHTRPGYFAPEE